MVSNILSMSAGKLMEAAQSAADTLQETTAQAEAAGHSYPTIRFPHLGIEINEMSGGFDVFGLHIAWYGVIIAIGMVLAAVLTYNLARRTGQNGDDYIDIAIATVIAGIIGARLYYVIFSWDYYSQHPGEIINLRNGGLAIYGGVILGAICIFVVSKIKKLKFLQIIDTCAPGVVIAQAIGRWGNFVNREAFGGYTDNFLAMQIKQADAAGVINDDLQRHILYIDGVKYIQVHPTFLYESIWCLLVFIGIMIFRKKARYHGEVVLWYFGGYALGRTIIEGLRTDSLYIWNTNIAISQLLAFLVFFASLAILIIMRIFIHKDPAQYPYVNLTVPGWRDLKFEKKKRKSKDGKTVSEAAEAAEPPSEDSEHKSATEIDGEPEEPKEPKEPEEPDVPKEPDAPEADVKEPSGSDDRYSN